MVNVILIDFQSSESLNSFHVEGLKEKLSKKHSEMNFWFESLLTDVNSSNFNLFINSPQHSNNILLHEYPKSLQYHTTSEQRVNHQSYIYQDVEYIHPEIGSIFNGEYSSYQLKVGPIIPPEHLFNYTGFTILLRLFIEKDSGQCILSFGKGSQWFQLNIDSITLNNEKNYFSFNNNLNNNNLTDDNLINNNNLNKLNPLKEGEWNDIYISYNNNSKSIIESIESWHFIYQHLIINNNFNREILCLLNGEEYYFDLSCIDNELLSCHDSSYLQTEMNIYFGKDSLFENQFIGLFSSIIIFNQSCRNFNELKFISSQFLKNHKKSTITYQQAINEL